MIEVVLAKDSVLIGRTACGFPRGDMKKPGPHAVTAVICPSRGRQYEEGELGRAALRG